MAWSVNCTKEVAGGLGSGLHALRVTSMLLLPLGTGQPWEGSLFGIKAPEQRLYKTWLIMRWGHVGSVIFYTGLQGRSQTQPLCFSDI